MENVMVYHQKLQTLNEAIAGTRRNLEKALENSVRGFGAGYREFSRRQVGIFERYLKVLKQQKRALLTR